MIVEHSTTHIAIEDYEALQQANKCGQLYYICRASMRKKCSSRKRRFFSPRLQTTHTTKSTPKQYPFTSNQSFRLFTSKSNNSFFLSNFAFLLSEILSSYSCCSLGRMSIDISVLIRTTASSGSRTFATCEFDPNSWFSC